MQKRVEDFVVPKMKSCGWMAVAAVVGAILTVSQPTRAQVANPPSQQVRHLGLGSDTPDPVFAAKRLRALNADRQKTMVSAADRLLSLAKQLDQEIASNPTGQLTPEEMHQAAEIEKLAKVVKEKMTQSFAGSLDSSPPPISSVVGPGVN